MEYGECECNTGQSLIAWNADKLLNIIQMDLQCEVIHTCWGVTDLPVKWNGIMCHHYGKD